ncbi:MAG: UDP-N-acetylmuramoyl-L-alanyl-D-glutamate--2,6-diaminopimelate ligase [Clostridia bacterium]|nr:UDP-N-acetylmuramoyl-L-alanyl-D-glutamate--2,6-diaminopimelate ligase [Clostridia bacterium]
MRFCDILSDVKILATNIPSYNFCFGKICSDSSKAELGDVFVCRRGSTADGHDFIEKAYKLGARTFIVDRITDYMLQNPQLRYIRVADTSLTEVKMLDAAYGYPSRGMKLIGITGTNGKTSTAYMIKAILDAAGYRTGLIGTVKSFAGEDDITHTSSVSKFSSMTTPSPVELFSLLADMKRRGCNAVVMEASSHALAQKRLDSLRFTVGIFTNLSEDHLDYHKDISDYRNAKAHLFDLCKTALINTDSHDGKLIANACPCNFFTYGTDTDADFFADAPLFESTQTSFTLCDNARMNIVCPIPGEFTLYNALAAASCAKLLGVTDEAICCALKGLKQIPGRLERVSVPTGTNVFIDYAHTPDALEKVLITLRKSCNGKLITVFGCGGDREREKRPIMGRIATSLSDITVITSDNPRSEDPKKIISEIAVGVKRNSDFRIIENRAQAIEFALSVSKAGDTVLLAGKGHEDYEVVGNEKRHFSEHEVIKSLYKER